MLVSIVVPVYNVGSYLERCLISVVNQSYRNLEIILVNDGSTDNSGEICERFQQNDDRIRLVRKENGGLSDARNSGLAHITGDYITFVDSDDILAQDFVAHMLNIAQKYDGDIVECKYVKFSEEIEITSNEKILPDENQVTVYNAEEALKHLFSENLKQVVWNKIYRASVIEGILFEKGRLHEDEFWTYQIVGKSKLIVQTDENLYYYRQQGESIMNKRYSIKRLDAVDAFTEQVDYVRKYFPKLESISIRRLFFGGMYTLQNLMLNPSLDADQYHTHRIDSILRKYLSWESIKNWAMKDRFWAILFVWNPTACIRLRNYLKMNI